ncbi:MAG TPA: hypothetical protein VG034_12910 [Acidimicrobiia bacterium]|jgi:hypothetical protein|nr:hypothetical protein [Acidimicrobiia bacterium]
MNRRFLFPLAAGIVGLVAISPALATESKKAPGKSSAPGKNAAPAKATTTSSDSGDSADPGDDPSADSGNKDGSNGNPSPGSGSGSGSGGQRSSSVCDPPETNQGPAPQMGDAPQTHEAGEAGSVDVERLSDTELRVAQASPNDGWTEQVATPSGPRITVKFTRQGQSPSLIRFAASMDQKGTMIHVRVTNCG